MPKMRVRGRETWSSDDKEGRGVSDGDRGGGDRRDGYNNSYSSRRARIS